MRKLFLICALLAAPLGAADLPTDSVSYLGFFRMPSGQAFMEGGLSLATGCLGQSDPSPSDGYPGCMMVIEKQLTVPGEVASLIVTDIVPPTSTGANRASTVVSRYDPLGTTMTDLAEWSGTQEKLFDIFVVESGTTCQKIHGVYKDYYQDTEVGYRTHIVFDCTTSPTVSYVENVEANPSPPTNAGADGYHPHKQVGSLAKIPAGIASGFGGYTEAYFGGNKLNGTNGRSAGLSITLREETGFSDYTNDIDLVPLAYYYTGTESSYQGFPTFYSYGQFTVPSGPDANIRMYGRGGEFLLDGTYEAAVALVQTPTWASYLYPANDANAGPKNCTVSNCTYADTPPYTDGDSIYSEEYRNYPAKYPDPDSDPVVWYGAAISTCDGYTNNYKQLPSFTDYIPGGAIGPLDCDVIDENAAYNTCGGGTGPQGLNLKTYMVFFSIPDLEDVYNGLAEGYEVVPYASLDITPDISNNGYDSEDWCHSMPLGTTYDETNNLLYVAFGKLGDGIVQVYEINAPDGVPPAPAEAESAIEGVATSGSSIGE